MTKPGLNQVGAAVKLNIVTGVLSDVLKLFPSVGDQSISSKIACEKSWFSILYSNKFFLALSRNFGIFGVFQIFHGILYWLILLAQFP